MTEHDTTQPTGPGEEHPDALLPWYANDTLEGDERQAVEDHLAGCERCRGEVEALRALRETLQGEAPAQGPGELGWRRLQRSVARERRRSTAGRLWRPALAAAAALVIVVETGLLVRQGTGPATYEPLEGGAADRAVLQVRFAPEATEAEIRRLLSDVGAEIVGGPGAIGVYRLAVEQEGAEAVARAAADLRQAESVVVEVRRQ